VLRTPALPALLQADQPPRRPGRALPQGMRRSSHWRLKKTAEAAPGRRTAEPAQGGCAVAGPDGRMRRTRTPPGAGGSRGLPRRRPSGESILVPVRLVPTLHCPRLGRQNSPRRGQQETTPRLRHRRIPGTPSRSRRARRHPTHGIGPRAVRSSGPRRCAAQRTKLNSPPVQGHQHRPACCRMRGDHLIQRAP
jgi:hypothetical protein